MARSKRVIFFGTENFSLPSLQALINDKWHVVAVVTKPDRPRGRRSQPVKPAVKQLAESFDIPVYQPNRLTDIESTLDGLQPDVGVLVSFGKLLPKSTLELFGPNGIVNVHPSLLPKYRGPSPIESAILNGDRQTGVSLIKLTNAMDAGPICSQSSVDLDGTESKPQLYKTLAELGAKELKKHLSEIINGKIEPKIQPNDGVSYTTLITKSDAWLSPQTDEAWVLERQIRAHLGFPKSKLELQDTVVIVTSAKVIETPCDNCLVVACAKDTYLQIDELVAPSGKTISGQAYLRGHS